MMTPSLYVTQSVQRASGDHRVRFGSLKLSCVIDNTSGSIYNVLKSVGDQLRGSSQYHIG